MTRYVQVSSGLMSLLMGCEIARKRFANLIQQLCLPSNPFDERTGVCYVFKQSHKLIIF